jgi:hypothetical protein
MMRKIATITLVTFPSPETSLVASSMPYLLVRMKTVENGRKRTYDIEK